jgi:uncharacterized protein HemX
MNTRTGTGSVNSSPTVEASSKTSWLAAWLITAGVLLGIAMIAFGYAHHQKKQREEEERQQQESQKKKPLLSRFPFMNS